MESSDTAACRPHDATTTVGVIGAARSIRLDTWGYLSLVTAVTPGGGVSTRSSEDWLDAVFGSCELHPIAQDRTFIGYADFGTHGRRWGCNAHLRCIVSGDRSGPRLPLSAGFADAASRHEVWKSVRCTCGSQTSLTREKA